MLTGNPQFALMFLFAQAPLQQTRYIKYLISKMTTIIIIIFHYAVAIFHPSKTVDEVQSSRLYYRNVTLSNFLRS